MSTTERMTPEQIEARLTEIAPPPDRPHQVTAEGLARWLLVRAQLGWSRNITPFARDDQLVPSSLIYAEFAAARALLGLAAVDREGADEVARQIACDWADVSGVGQFTWEGLKALGIDPAEVSWLDAERLAAENAERAGETTP